MPEYEVYACKDWCECTLRYRVSVNDKGISQYQRVGVIRAASRSKAREEAAWARPWARPRLRNELPIWL